LRTVRGPSASGSKIAPALIGRSPAYERVEGV
jgi:hypothetical protein